MSRPFTWSYTALMDFESCPRAYAAKRYFRSVKEEESEALRWGNAVHKALEDRLGDGTPLPEGMTEYEEWVRALEQAPHVDCIEVEREMAVTRELKVTGWFDEAVWARGKIDVLLWKDGKATAHIKDWKTGKRIKDDPTQIEVFALMLLAIEPRCERVFGQNIWLKHRQASPTHPVCVTREMFYPKWRELIVRVNRMEEAWKTEHFPARENGLCKAWCPVTDCIHNGRKQV